MDRDYVRYGMVGGDLSAFIGGVHRNAINFFGRAKLVAACFSRDENKNKETAEFYNVNKERVYDNFKEMATKEAIRQDKIDFVCITTPNNYHYEICKAFLEEGFNVVCEKPLCFNVEEALELEKLAKEKNILFCITYAYCGYEMVKYAKSAIKKGLIGDILNVYAEYSQEWLIDNIGQGKSQTSKMPTWRSNPLIAGISNCTGDIGTHIENVVHYMSGLNIKRVAGKLDSFGEALDLNSNVLIEYENGASGNYWSSQIAVGHSNDLRIRIYGKLGSIEWIQEDNEHLTITLKGEPKQVLTRGCGYVDGIASTFNRIPSGHPEGYFEGFANIYKSYINAVLKKINGEVLTEIDMDFPSIKEGVNGVKFVNAVVESGNKDSAWVYL